MQPKHKTSLQSDLAQFLLMVQAPSLYKTDLQQLSKLVQSRAIANTPVNQRKIVWLLSLLFISAYPQLCTDYNRNKTIQYLSRLF